MNIQFHYIDQILPWTEHRLIEQLGYGLKRAKTELATYATPVQQAAWDTFIKTLRPGFVHIFTVTRGQLRTYLQCIEDAGLYHYRVFSGGFDNENYQNDINRLTLDIINLPADWKPKE